MRATLLVLLILGIFFVLLSSIFFLAAFSPFSLSLLVEATILFIIGIIFLLLYYRGMKMDAQRAVELKQRIIINTSEDLGGDAKLHDLKCRHCGATLTEKDVSITNAGVIVKCPYCGAVYRLEEEPKW